MTDRERDQFQEAFKGARSFLLIIRDHFQLDLVAH